MITKDGIVGVSRHGAGGLVGALGSLSKNPFLKAKAVDSQRSNPVAWRGENISELRRGGSLASTPSKMDQAAAGAASVFVRTGILQNPNAALGAQATQSGKSLARLLD